MFFSDLKIKYILGLYFATLAEHNIVIIQSETLIYQNLSRIHSFCFTVHNLTLILTFIVLQFATFMIEIPNILHSGELSSFVPWTLF